MTNKNKKKARDLQARVPGLSYQAAMNALNTYNNGLRTGDFGRLPPNIAKEIEAMRAEGEE